MHHPPSNDADSNCWLCSPLVNCLKSTCAPSAWRRGRHADHSRGPVRYQRLMPPPQQDFSVHGDTDDVTHASPPAPVTAPSHSQHNGARQGRQQAPRFFWAVWQWPWQLGFPPDDSEASTALLHGMQALSETPGGPQCQLSQAPTQLPFSIGTARPSMTTAPTQHSPRQQAPHPAEQAGGPLRGGTSFQGSAMDNNMGNPEPSPVLALLDPSEWADGPEPDARLGTGLFGGFGEEDLEMVERSVSATCQEALEHTDTGRMSRSPSRSPSFQSAASSPPASVHSATSIGNLSMYSAYSAGGQSMYSAYSAGGQSTYSVGSRVSSHGLGPQQGLARRREAHRAIGPTATRIPTALAGPPRAAARGIELNDLPPNPLLGAGHAVATEAATCPQLHLASTRV